MIARRLFLRAAIAGAAGMIAVPKLGSWYRLGSGVLVPSPAIAKVVILHRSSDDVLWYRFLFDRNGYMRQQEAPSLAGPWAELRPDEAQLGYIEARGSTWRRHA